MFFFVVVVVRYDFHSNVTFRLVWFVQKIQKIFSNFSGLCSSSVTAALALMTVITQLLLYGQT